MSKILVETGQPRVLQNVGNNCIRAWWTALAPTSVVAFNLARLLYNRLPYRPLSSTFSNFLPLEEAVSLLNENANGVTRTISSDDWDLGHEHKKDKWKVGILVVPAGLETAYWGFWICRFVLELLRTKDEDDNTPVAAYEVVTTTLLAISWLYALLRPLFLRKPLTIPYDLFTLYLSMLGVTGLNIGAIIYKEYVYGPGGPAPRTDHGTILALMVHVFILFVLLSVTVSLHTGIPPRGVDREKIGTTITPEDYTTLAQWITFWWIYPVVKRVSRSLLDESRLTRFCRVLVEQ